MPKAHESKVKDPELKKKWVSALRSGRYIQGKGKLKTIVSLQNEVVAGYCCLGVLCDTIAPDGWRTNNFHSFTDKSSQEMYPNTTAMKDLGIYPSMLKKLGTMNDDDNQSFEQIADYIEKHL